MKSWLLFLLLGLLCNALGIFLHRQGAEGAAITLVVLGIINVATAFILHWKIMKKEE
jgi:prepilin signal peptidase PulO-like enzyme (type II secretory pathway)